MGLSKSDVKQYMPIIWETATHVQDNHICVKTIQTEKKQTLNNINYT